MADVCWSVGKQPCWHQPVLSLIWDDSPGVSWDLWCQTGYPGPPGDSTVVAVAESPRRHSLAFDVLCIFPECPLKVTVIVTLNAKRILIAIIGRYKMGLKYRIVVNAIILP